MSVWPKFSISDGTGANDRFPRALEAGYFLPDERRFEELLAVGAELAATLPFHDLKNAPKGTWGDLFMVNEAAVMALILSKDTKQLESGFFRCMELGLQESVRFVYRTARDIDLWLVKLGDCRGRAGMELRERIEALVRERLSPELRDLVQIVGLFREKTWALDGLDFRGFHPLWGLQLEEGEAVTPVRHTMRPRDAVRGIFSSFLNVIAVLRSLVPPYLEESLQARTHEPAIALFIVFLNLLEKARIRLNGFTARHLDFYYRRVLGATARPHEPDHLFFSLETAKGQTELRVPAGTEFLTTAGSGGEEILVASEQDAVVSDAQVDSLCTLRFERDRFISPEREFGYVTRVKAIQRDLRAGVGASQAAALPLFGTSSRLAVAEPVRDAKIGFAVASPVLLLREGQRIIEVHVELGDPGESSHLRNEVLRRAEGEERQDSASLAEIFENYLSAEGDWLDAAEVVDRDQVAERLAANIEPGESARAFQQTRQTGRNVVYDLFLRALLRQPIACAQRLQSLLGRIFQRYVLTVGECLDADFKREILERAAGLLDGDALNAVSRLLTQGHTEIFQTLLKDVFEISVTVPTGWHPVDKYVMNRLEAGGERALGGLRFLLTLGPEVDPVVAYSPDVHGGQWGGTSPLIRFRLNRLANFCAYSLFNASRLRSVVIDVRVLGLRDLRLYNNVGRIDPSKPFQPFGPLPTLSSYFVFGSYEMAQKHLTDLTLKLEWADVPTCFGGFGAHYAGYERSYADVDFQVGVSVLQDGSWQPQLEQQRTVASLFQPTRPAERLQTTRSLGIGGLDFFRPIDRKITEEKFDLQLGVRNGFFRLGLCGPGGAFGHADYPLLLSKALSENIRSKVFKSVPNAPYTPLLSQVSVDYRARARIRAEETRSGGLSEQDQRIFHLHPFGYEEVQPVRAGKVFSLLPKYDTDGNLFIGVTGGGGARSLTLLFHLNEETNQETSFESPDLAWYYLSARGWRQLPASSIVLDTTNGFLSSGIVTLTLPQDLDRESTLMPAGKAWVRVGANRHLDAFPAIYSVRANGIQATRRIDASAGETLTAHVPAGCTWRTAVPIRGLGGIVQVGGSFGGAPTEDPRRFQTRISERLCHKNRAVTAWDYERLILQRFPDVFKVKCFADLVAADAKPRPGHVLIVVVSNAGGNEGTECRRPMIDVLELKKIRQFVQEISSPFVQVEVRNPLYERIQVRCKAKFVDDANPGFYIRKLNRDVSAFLCPWIPFGYQARFGWMISREEVEGFIRGRDYVEFVTDFSMLHITEDDRDSYTLDDTIGREPVRESGEEADRVSRPVRRRSDQVHWRYPWSLAVPMERHFIEAVRVMRWIEPEPVGIGEVEIGGTFIINGTD